MVFFIEKTHTPEELTELYADINYSINWVRTKKSPLYCIVGSRA